MVVRWQDFFFKGNFIIAIALDETSILAAFHFSMKNIYQACDLCRASNVLY